MPDKGNLIWHPPFPDIIPFPISYDSLAYVFLLAFSPFYC